MSSQPANVVFLRPRLELRGPQLPLLATRDLVIVVGKRGTGKSTFVKRHLRRELAAGKRVVVGDVHDEYSRAGRASKEVELGPLAGHVTVDELVDANFAQLDLPRLSCAVLIGGPDIAFNAEVLINAVCSTGDVLLALSEVGIWEERCREHLRVLATQGRHWSVPVIAESQRMTHFFPNFRSQATRLVMFRQTHPEDLDALVEVTGDESLRVKVPALADGEYLLWQDDTQRTHPS